VKVQVDPDVPQLIKLLQKKIEGCGKEDRSSMFGDPRLGDLTMRLEFRENANSGGRR
jgi:hypothetical protein